MNKTIYFYPFKSGNNLAEILRRSAPKRKTESAIIEQHKKITPFTRQLETEVINAIKEAEEEIKKKTNGHKIEYDFAITIFHDDEMSKRYADSQSIFRGLTQNDQIYVLGHGSSGQDLIYADGSNENIDSETLVKLLIRCGLEEPFSGKIKLFSCYSAVSGLFGFSKSFAYLVKKRLKENNYNNCKVFGYQKSVIAEYRNIGLPNENTHKYYNITKSKSDKNVLVGERASECRIEVAD